MNYPRCHRCIRAGLSCGGYCLDTQFIQWTSAGADRPLLRSVNNSNNNNNNSSIVLSNALATSARKQLYHGAFASGMLPGGRHYSAKAANYGAVGWANSVFQLCECEEALNYALISTGMALMAIDNRDVNLRLQSIQAHNRALNVVAKAALQPNWFNRDGILACIRLLLGFEVRWRGYDNLFPSHFV